MRKSLYDWASISEVVSGIAVVVSLVFLIFGIRANTEVTRVSIYERNIDSLMQWRSDLIQDREIASLWETYVSGNFDTLDSTDRIRLNQLVANIFNVYEKAYFAQEYEVMGSSEWPRFERMSCVQYAWAVQNEMIPILDVIMTEQFMSFLKETCANEKPGAQLKN